jgi:hypothetical protein
MADLRKRLIAITIAPTDSEAFERWLGQEDAVAFLEEDGHSDEVVLYASLPHTFLTSVLVPTSELEPLNVDDLLKWSLRPDGTWSVWASTDDIGIAPPLEDSDSKALRSGEQLLISRSFEGRLGDQHYFELSQKFTHTSDLHYVPERRAWCKLDHRGDIVDLVRVVEIPERGSSRGGLYIVANRRLVDEYTFLTDAALIRLFDFTRVRFDGFSGWTDGREEKRAATGTIHARLTIDPGIGSYSRGFQILRSSATKKQIIDRLWGRSAEQKQYVKFIAHDWKNRIVKEISCNPECLANYFIESPLPFEISPAFFRPEVLVKYKSDSEKYTLDKRSITCRGAWHLKTYDINEAGQVHTYLVYLSQLPYEEQLHWKSYNEAPKAPISRRAYTTDFEGQFSDEADALSTLKYRLRELDRQQVPWWGLRSEDLFEKAHAPFTQAADEWANDILALDQLLIEGFETKWLKRKATSLGRTLDSKFASLKITEECLLGLGFDEADAADVVAPLRELHDLRSKLKGHVAGETARALKQKALSEHGSYRDQFLALCARCDASLERIAAALKA